MMLLRPRASTQVLLVRPGSTEFDEQGRMKGSLDIPLSKSGRMQAQSVASELSTMDFTAIYSAPGRSARQTAKRLAEGREARVKVVDGFRNIDHGLWHGKLIEEVKRNQPRVYKCGQDSPDEVCPPQGESIREAQARVLKAVRKLIKRPRQGVVAMVIPDPLATIVEAYLRGEKLSDLWKAERDNGAWTLIQPR